MLLLDTIMLAIAVANIWTFRIVVSTWMLTILAIHVLVCCTGFAAWTNGLSVISCPDFII